MSSPLGKLRTTDSLDLADTSQPINMAFSSQSQHAKKAIKTVVVASLIAGVSLACNTIPEVASDGPSIHILTSTENGGNVTIRGYVEDINTPESLRVGGQDFGMFSAVYDHEFNVTVPRTDVIDIEAFDSLGNRTVNSYAKHGYNPTPSVAVRLNQSALDFVFEELITGIDLDLNAQTSMEPRFYLLDGFTIEARTDTISFDAPTIGFDIQEEDNFDLDVELGNFDMSMVIAGDINGWLEISSPQIAFGTDLYLNITDTVVSAAMSNTSLDLGNKTIKLHDMGLLGWIVNFFLPALTDYFVGIFVDGADSGGGDFLEDFLQDLAIRGSVGNINLDFGLANLGSNDGGLVTNVAGSIITDPAHRLKPFDLGYFYEETDEPTMGAKTRSGLDYDFGLMIGSNLINQSFHAAFERGLFNLNITAIENQGVSVEGVSVFADANEEIYVGDELSFQTEMSSPPTFEILGNKNGAVSGVINLKGFSFTYSMKRNGWFSSDWVYRALLDVQIPFLLGVDRTTVDVDGVPTDLNNLKMSADGSPGIHLRSFQVNDSSAQGAIPLLSPQFFDHMINHFLPIISPNITAVVETVPTFGVPTYTVMPVEFWGAGLNYGYLAVAANLVKTEIADADIPPTDVAISFVPTTNPAGVVNGTVTLNFTATDTTASHGAVQFKHRLDGGEWSVWSTATQVRYGNLLGGAHEVQVCARTALLKESPICPTATFNTIKP